jgi:nicotinamidase-related amidase
VNAAVVTNECQKGAIGDVAMWHALKEAAAPMIPVLKRLLDAARTAGLPVIHCVAVRRADLRGASRNAPLFDVANRTGGFATGSESAELVEELGPQPGDLVHAKTHGLASLRSTGVDNALRNLDVDTIVLTGVSVNVAIPTLAFEAVNLGYRVVIPRDAVAGVPPSYADDVLRHTLSLVAELTSAADVMRTLA